MNAAVREKMNSGTLKYTIKMNQTVFIVIL